MRQEQSIDGFDPLADDVSGSDSLLQIMDIARRRDVQNILKSYTGYFDLFSEATQNALDALEKNIQANGKNYVPRIWIYIDVPNSRVRIVDNGCGMDEQQFKFCLRPNISFKTEAGTRGHKGVGATFLAYGFSFFKLQTRANGTAIAATLRQGRQWAEDQSGTIPRPKFQQIPFDVPELANQESGTCVEIVLGKASGERPKDLGWLGAQTAAQWLELLRIKTPLGGVYLNTPPFQPTIYLEVKSVEGVATKFDNFKAEYMYPHEMTGLKVQSLRSIEDAQKKIQGDSATKFQRTPSEYKKLDCIYEIWDKDTILSSDGVFPSLTEEQRILVEKHKVIVYGSFLRSARIWAEYNDDVLKLRKNSRIIHGGLQMASDFMVQGDLSVIPLTSAIGYQNNSHIIVHFTDGNPDLGRKVFQPELKGLAEALAIRVVTIFRRFLQFVKPDTGAQVIAPDKELYDWKKSQEEYRDKYNLSFQKNERAIAMISCPQQE